ncbi:uncharacterized protein LOC144500312 isoform X2 [Mustelus asterias]
MRNQLWSVPPFRKMPDRRIRKARFKDRDLRVLIDSVMERRGDIFGEGGQPPTMQSRRQAWLFVMEKVNAVSGTRRTWEEVRKKVHDLKKSTKEKLAYNRRARQLSCGSRPDIKTLTEFENDMILLFGKESFEGLDAADLGVMSRLSDQGETSGSSTTAAKQHRTHKYQMSSPQAEAGTSIDTPTGGGGSIEDEEELACGLSFLHCIESEGTYLETNRMEVVFTFPENCIAQNVITHIAEKQSSRLSWSMLVFKFHRNLPPLSNLFNKSSLPLPFCVYLTSIKCIDATRFNYSR